MICKSDGRVVQFTFKYVGENESDWYPHTECATAPDASRLARRECWLEIVKFIKANYPKRRIKK